MPGAILFFSPNVKLLATPPPILIQYLSDTRLFDRRIQADSSVLNLNNNLNFIYS